MPRLLLRLLLVLLLLRLRLLLLGCIRVVRLLSLRSGRIVSGGERSELLLRRRRRVAVLVQVRARRAGLLHTRRYRRGSIRIICALLIRCLLLLLLRCRSFLARVGRAIRIVRFLTVVGLLLRLLIVGGIMLVLLVVPAIVVVLAVRVLLGAGVRVVLLVLRVRFLTVSRGERIVVLFFVGVRIRIRGVRVSRGLAVVLLSCLRTVRILLSILGRVLPLVLRLVAVLLNVCGRVVALALVIRVRQVRVARRVEDPARVVRRLELLALIRRRGFVRLATVLGALSVVLLPIVRIRSRALSPLVGSGVGLSVRDVLLLLLAVTLIFGAGISLVVRVGQVRVARGVVDPAGVVRRVELLLLLLLRVMGSGVGRPGGALLVRGRIVTLLLLLPVSAIRTLLIVVVVTLLAVGIPAAASLRLLLLTPVLLLVLAVHLGRNWLFLLVQRLEWALLCGAVVRRRIVVVLRSTRGVRRLLLLLDVVLLLRSSSTVAGTWSAHLRARPQGCQFEGGRERDAGGRGRKFKRPPSKVRAGRTRRGLGRRGRVSRTAFENVA